jgi:hypothetical protein
VRGVNVFIHTVSSFVKREMPARSLYLLLAAAGAQGVLLGRTALVGSVMPPIAARRVAAPVMIEEADPEKIAKALKAMTGFANSYCAQRSRRNAGPQPAGTAVRL